MMFIQYDGFSSSFASGLVNIYVICNKFAVFPIFPCIKSASWKLSGLQLSCQPRKQLI